MINGLVDIAKPTIDTFLEKNVALKKLGGKIKPAEFVPWLAKNWEGFAKQAEPIANAVKGNKALKSMSNFLGPVDIVVDSLFAVVDYAAGGESVDNAVVKAGIDFKLGKSTKPTLISMNDQKVLHSKIERLCK